LIGNRRKRLKQREAEHKQKMMILPRYQHLLMRAKGTRVS
jgi:hypothetical protein